MKESMRSMERNNLLVTESALVELDHIERIVLSTSGATRRPVVMRLWSARLIGCLFAGDEVMPAKTFASPKESTAS